MLDKKCNLKERLLTVNQECTRLEWRKVDKKKAENFLMIKDVISINRTSESENFSRFIRNNKNQASDVTKSFFFIVTMERPIELVASSSELKEELILFLEYIVKKS